MKYCKHCGAEIDDACVVCPKCGKQVEEVSANAPVPPNMRVCKVCGKPIAKTAKVCPHCGAKKKGKLGLIIGIIIAVIVIFALIGGGSKKTDKPAPNASSAPASEAEAEKQQEEVIEYKEATMLDLTKALDSNAMNAEETYQGQYYKVIGTIDNIDSDGDYISINNGADILSEDHSFYSMQCFLKDEEAKNKIRQLSKGDTVTVSGKITEVGEVIGYTMDVDVIE